MPLTGYCLSIDVSVLNDSSRCWQATVGPSSLSHDGELRQGDFRLIYIYSCWVHLAIAVMLSLYFDVLFSCSLLLLLIQKNCCMILEHVGCISTTVNRGQLAETIIYCITIQYSHIVYSLAMIPSYYYTDIIYLCNICNMLLFIRS